MDLRALYTTSDFLNHTHTQTTRCFYGCFFGHINETSLNCTYGRQDPDEKVIDNRHTIQKAMEDLAYASNPPHRNSTTQLCFLKQNHTNHVIDLDQENGVEKTPLKADAMVTTQYDLWLGIQTADCIPILFYDPTVPMIGAAHAGWRGLANGIIENTLSLMEKKGAQRSHMRVIIGPCIWQESYTVQDDLRQIFSKYPNALKSSDKEMSPSYQLDTPFIAQSILKEQGVMMISPSPFNTYTDARFFSYRRHTHQKQPHLGNQASVIGMCEPF